MSQLESEKRYLEKSNRHLEKILEATNAYKKHEVSELNRMHVETLKVINYFNSDHCKALKPRLSVYYFADSLRCIEEKKS